MKAANFSSSMKRSFRLAGISASNITTHSLRAGVATDAAAMQLPKTVIQRLRRWRSEAYKVYIRPNVDQTASIAAQLASGPHTLICTCIN